MLQRLRTMAGPELPGNAARKIALQINREDCRSHYPSPRRCPHCDFHFGSHATARREKARELLLFVLADDLCGSAYQDTVGLAAPIQAIAVPKLQRPHVLSISGNRLSLVLVGHQLGPMRTISYEVLTGRKHLCFCGQGRYGRLVRAGKFVSLDADTEHRRCRGVDDQKPPLGPSLE